MTTAPPLVGVAHGSRDPRSAATVAELMDVVRARHPELDVRTAFLDLSAPRLRDVLGGVTSAVVVPLLLGHAYHARVDVPGEVARSGRPGVLVTDVLGPAVEAAALDRLAAVAGPLDDPALGVVLAGVGSSHAPANAVVAAAAAEWRDRFGWAGARAAFATAEPSVTDAIAQLRAAGARRIAVAQWVLAPGLLPDRIARAAAAAGAVVGEPLGAHPAVADLVVARYRETLARERVRRRAG
ncbi:sirohydrochlorin chelatase [Pseudonocardia thermophila]|uniref:sirohydrochlorin chelatase n=1 Tax=Pseudonocardia thermophila TaxID=1848 RepID=UPI00248EA3FC|nr:sirohydrochlorin chelatase [Pseudonocardia thermophila]